MALPASGALSFAAIAAEYEKSSSNFSMGQCASLNSNLPTSSTAQWSASEFHTARYGPDTVTLTAGYDDTLGLDWYGYSQTTGSVTSRSIHEVGNRLIHFINASNGRLYFDASSFDGIWKLMINTTDLWATKSWDGNQYWWTGALWSGIGQTTDFTYLYDD